MYFAYGSNMSRARLQERTDLVVHKGRAILRDYAHAFSHRGRDGSAKGNIEIASGCSVHGVIYGLTTEQQQILHPYEGGYDIIEVRVQLALNGEELDAYTYMAKNDAEGLRPTSSYLAYYLKGMEENDFPQLYIESIRKQSQSG